MAGGDDHVLRALRPGQRRTQSDEHGTDGGSEAAFDLLGARNLANGAAEIARITEVDGGDGGDGPGNDLLGIDLHAQRKAHEDGELGAGVESAHVFSGVGLGVAFGLRFGQHGRVFRAGLHFAQDEIAGAVENAFDALDAIAGHALLKAGNDGDSAGHGRAVLEMAALGRGQPLQVDAVKGNEFFVGGDNAFAGFKSAAHPGSRGIESAGQLDDHIDIGGENRIGVFAPDHACRRPVNTLARHAAVEDVGKLEALRIRFDEDARHRTAHRAKTENGDAQRLRGARVASGRCVKRRCGAVHFRHWTFL